MKPSPISLHRHMRDPRQGHINQARRKFMRGGSMFPRAWQQRKRATTHTHTPMTIMSPFDDAPEPSAAVPRGLMQHTRPLHCNPRLGGGHTTGSAQAAMPMLGRAAHCASEVARVCACVASTAAGGAPS